MRSGSPMIWVHGTTADGVERKAAVVFREGETLEDAIGRGACYILDDENGSASTYLTGVWSETMDEYEYHRFSPLMDGSNPGGFLTEERERC